MKIKVESLIQFDIALNSTLATEIILARDSFSESELLKCIKKIKKAKKISWVMLERISRYEESDKQELRLSTDAIFGITELDGVIVQNIDSFAHLLRKINTSANEKLMVELNYTMNCYNNETKKVYESLYNEKRKNAKEVPLLFTAPVELHHKEISEVGFDTLVIYSYIDVMVTANCLRKNTIDSNSLKNICKNRFNYENVNNYGSYIIDRKNKKLHYKTYCKYCYNKIFNTEPLYLIDKLPTLDYKSYRLDFSFENEKEMKDILLKKCPASFTRGHFANSIK